MKRLYILIALAVALAIANASVFVYYTGTLTLQPVRPPIIFVEGSNARQPDLAGRTIIVTISDANTTLSITVHPTYQINYYKNITLIKNLDGRAYHVYIKVKDPMGGGNLTSAYLIVNRSGTLVPIDLTSGGPTSQPQYIGILNAGSQWTINLNFTLTNLGTARNNPNAYNQAPKITDAYAEIQLIYSPSTETPP